MNSAQIITGEKIQQLADVYIGTLDDLCYNPLIREQFNKHKYINDITCEYDNPRIVFCYTHIIPQLSNIVRFFKNPFILISHNSDYNIYDTEETRIILDSEKVYKWFSQNVCFFHSKLYMVPIGLANRMWAHGNLDIFDNPSIYIRAGYKIQKTFFNFSIHTNRSIREPCFEILKHYIEWLPTIDSDVNIIRMSEYEFCICPEGNGADCHRIWEALYVKTVPIMIKSPFTETLLRNGVPLVLLDHWGEYYTVISDLQYSDYIFGDYSLDTFTSNGKLIHNQNQNEC